MVHPIWATSTTNFFLSYYSESSIKKYLHCAHTSHPFHFSYLSIYLYHMHCITYIHYFLPSYYLTLRLSYFITFSTTLYPKTLKYLYNYNRAYLISLDPKFPTTSTVFLPLHALILVSAPNFFPFFVRTMQFPKYFPNKHVGAFLEHIGAGD
jgi:hypothetical protein